MQLAGETMIKVKVKQHGDFVHMTACCTSTENNKNGDFYEKLTDKP